jgi:hypothetical protein
MRAATIASVSSSLADSFLGHALPYEHASKSAGIAVSILHHKLQMNAGHCKVCLHESGSSKELCISHRNQPGSGQGPSESRHFFSNKNAT